MVKTKRASKSKSGQDESSASASARKRPKKEDESTSGASDDKKKPSKTKTKPQDKVQCITERDVIPKLWDSSMAEKKGSATFKIASWNVDGLRAVLKNTPDALSKLVTTHDIDVLCLQETKLQESHLDDPKLNNLRHVLDSEGYDAYWSCSTAKKGYSGTAVFVKRRGCASESKRKTISTFFQPKASTTASAKAVGSDDLAAVTLQKVSYDMGTDKHNAEGRMISVDFGGFSLTNLYVPNSGQKLERLAYRTKEWDQELLAFMQKTEKERGVPVMWLGDLNVAHSALDVYNEGAKHLSKQAGTTPEERTSFQEQVDSGFVDAFRWFHPDAKGQYTYWSVRAGNRLTNKGLRLDYFVCSPSLFKDDAKIVARDCYMLHDQQGSDHCPIVLELEVKK